MRNEADQQRLHLPDVFRAIRSESRDDDDTPRMLVLMVDSRRAWMSRDRRELRASRLACGKDIVVRSELVEGQVIKLPWTEKVVIKVERAALLVLAVQ